MVFHPLKMRDLVTAWAENRLPTSCAVLDTVAGTFSLQDPHDCTVAACWGVDTTMRWVSAGAKRNREGYGRKDERFTEVKPAMLPSP